MDIDARFYKTYEICGIIDEIIRNPVEYQIQLEGFYCDDRWTSFIEPFKKYSILHEFIEYILNKIHMEQLSSFNLKRHQKVFLDFKDIPEALIDLKLTKLPIELALDQYGIEYESFTEYIHSQNKTFETTNEDDIHEYMIELWLSQPYHDLMHQMIPEIFHILFQNRELQFLLNTFISHILEKNINQINNDNKIILEKYLTKNGTIKRFRIPAWVKKAIFFRDRGRCVLCNKDLTGLINLDNINNIDHIVPLKLHGLNDITNLQLLCLECNQHEKRDGMGYTSKKYQSWYSDSK